MLASLYFSVRMGASLCAHGGKPLPLILRTFWPPGATPPNSRALLWFPSIWGTFFLPLSVATCFRNTLQARLRVRSRGSSEWAPHSPPSVQSPPAALQSTLSCRHLVWKLTMMMEARARSPSEGWGRDNMQRRNLRRRERAPPPQVHEQRARVYRSICSPTE